MPDLFALLETYEVRVCCYTTTQIALNVLHYICLQTTGTPPDLTIGAQAFDTLFFANYKSMIATTASYRGVTVKRLTQVQSIAYPWVSHAGAGSGSSTVLPTQTCGLITIRTRFGGSGYRGRAYLPFIGNTGSDTNGSPNAGLQTLMGNIAISMGPTISIVGGLGSASLTQVIRRRGFPMTSDPQVIGYTVPPRFATQRRRGQYGQPNVLPF